MKQIMGIFLSILLVTCITNCGGEETGKEQTKSLSHSPGAELLADMMLSEKPEGVIPLRDALATEQYGQEIVVSGKVGEITPRYAAFRLYDSSLQDCNREDKHCPTPWDYCCEPPDRVQKGSVFVEFKDTQGKVIKADILNYRDIYYLANVDVKGQLSKDETGNVRLVATGIHIAQKTPLDVALYERKN
jgi:hypothetical protein